MSLNSAALSVPHEVTVDPVRNGRTADQAVSGVDLGRPKTIVVGHLAGIEIAVHRAWPLALLVTAWLLADRVVPTLAPHLSAPTCMLIGLLIALAESASGLAHELAHAVVALAHGRRVRSITLYAFAAATRRGAGATARERALIALAGPFSHFVLALVFWLLFHVLPPAALPLRLAMVVSAWVNVLIGMVNLLPFSPLDGARVFEAVRQESGEREARVR